MHGSKALNGMSDEQLVDFMSTQDSQGRWGPDQATTNRETAKAIMDIRSAKVIQQQNQVMIQLTHEISGLTYVLVALTFVLIVLTAKTLYPNFNFPLFIKNILLKIHRFFTWAIKTLRSK